MKIIDSLLAEMDQEAGTTRRVLERIPEDKLTWKPHEKSFSLGELSTHVATIPGMIAQAAAQDTFDVSNFKAEKYDSRAEILKALDQSLAKAHQVLAPLDDAKLMATWSLTIGGKPGLQMPRIAVIRAILLNHWYHHRGQLSVYLRLLNVPVPSIYGPSADENPFAPK
jgi:uncharacterized damage-inducible protein DinB